MLVQRRICLAVILSLGLSAPVFARPGGMMGHPQRLAAMVAQYDQNQDGTVTMEEIQAGRAAEFAQADSNAYGLLSLEELQVLIETKRAARHAARFASLDTDGNGQLSVTEFQAARRAPVDRSATLFGLADANNDGVLNSEEMTQLKSPQGRTWRKFARFDSNGDGVISATEYATAMPAGPRRGGRPGRCRQ